MYLVCQFDHSSDIKAVFGSQESVCDRESSHLQNNYNMTIVSQYAYGKSQGYEHDVSFIIPWFFVCRRYVLHDYYEQFS